MLTGFLIVGNLIGEFSNILLSIQESSLTEEEQNFDFVIQTMHITKIPEIIQERVIQFLEPQSV